MESGNAVLTTIQNSENGRALKYLKEREKNRAELEKKKQAEEAKSKKRQFASIDNKYGASHADSLEAQFSKEIVGLVSAKEFKEKRAKIDELIRTGQSGAAAAEPKKAVVKSRIKTAKLSFGDEVSDSDSNSDSEEAPPPKKKFGFGKDKSVDTSFLADAERDSKLNSERAKLIAQYEEEQEVIKAERLQITYSYWDGSGHRREIEVTKGHTIQKFLHECRVQLQAEFPELKGKPAENLLYIKEDLIIPHHTTFYELIKNKARGKSGPLFAFDVHEDIRQLNDSRVEKDESHAGKIVDRKWSLKGLIFFIQFRFLSLFFFSFQVW